MKFDTGKLTGGIYVQLETSAETSRLNIRVGYADTQAAALSNTISPKEARALALALNALAEGR